MVSDLLANWVLLLFLAEAEPEELELELEVSAPLATEPRVLKGETGRPDRARGNRACSRRNSVSHGTEWLRSQSWRFLVWVLQNATCRTISLRRNVCEL